MGLFSRLRARSDYFSGHYDEWRNRRITAIVSHYGPLWFKGKTVLELGAGYGDIGAALQGIGAQVTCSEAREEHVAKIRRRHPNIEVIKANMEHEWPFTKKYDLILHLGLLYHLKNINFSVEKSLSNAMFVALETEVCDSDDPNFVLRVTEDKTGYDQSFIGIGSRPSAPYVERLFENVGARFDRISDSRCNSYFHTYDWNVTNTGDWCNGLRRFWFVATK